MAEPLIKQNMTKKEKEAGVVRWLMISFFFAPVPFFMCFDSCAGDFFAPLVIAWMPLTTIFSFFSLTRFFWHIIFALLYFSIFYPLNIQIRNKSWVKEKYKDLFFFILMIVYWIAVSAVWYKIPEEIRHMLLNI